MVEPQRLPPIQFVIREKGTAQIFVAKAAQIPMDAGLTFADGLVKLLRCFVFPIQLVDGYLRRFPYLVAVSLELDPRYEAADENTARATLAP